MTILYRLLDNELDGKTSIYFLSGVVGYDFTEQSKFSIVPNNDIAYISLQLPCQLRSTYSLVKIPDNVVDNVVSLELESSYPRFVGEALKFAALEKYLFENNHVITDPLNKKEMVYYQDMDDPDKIYGKESILELPMAPCLGGIPTSFMAVKSVRDQLKDVDRFIKDKLDFSTTCLRDMPGYTDLSLTRKYWIYLPKYYDQNAIDAYPFMLFLDGSSYLDYIPTHCMLEKMIDDGIIPPCVAVFIDSLDGLPRSIEYNCNAQFTQFLTHDFIDLLRTQHGLNITNNPKYATIVGTSYGGLAAFYAGLTNPDIFGNVIAQSPAFVSQEVSVLDQMITDFAAKNCHAEFIFEMGSFENNAVELEFESGMIQNISSLDAVSHVYDQMKQHDISVYYHEFVGGHNYVCWQVSLFDRIRDVYRDQLEFCVPRL